ncbi:hypothetical protein [Paraburkholderia caribensis]|uniref:hypothetical protein n=1 Tax=Paraburkholderia caribensis TaxID=75105 RepID=UPI00078D81EA|nr:hypothetical protein [Paraburkholderia caribensis]AMV44340.1 hypothetical protein ATN79_20575 [Paraburkholderia caribensis]
MPEKNIEDFNLAVAQLLGELYRTFPKKIRLCASEFLRPPDTSAMPDDQEQHDALNRWLDLVDTYNHTAYFLLEEGYICGSRSDKFTTVENCRLTSKGLAALQKVPASLRERDRPIGELFLEIGRGALKEGAKELAKASVVSLLSAH